MSTHEPSAEARFGAIVKALRAARGLSQRQVATEMVDRGHDVWVQSTVGRTEAGDRPLRLNEFLTLCHVLGADADDTVRELVDTSSSDVEMQLAEVRAAARAVHESRLHALMRAEDLAEQEQLLTAQYNQLLADAGRSHEDVV